VKDGGESDYLIILNDEVASRVPVVEITRETTRLEFSVLIRQRADKFGHVVLVQLPQPLGNETSLRGEWCEHNGHNPILSPNVLRHS